VIKSSGRRGPVHGHGGWRARVNACHQQDHKRFWMGTTVPNGWHGRLFTRPVVTPALHAKVMRQVIIPPYRAWREGEKYTGFCIRLNDRWSSNIKVLDTTAGWRPGNPTDLSAHEGDFLRCWNTRQRYAGQDRSHGHARCTGGSARRSRYRR